jgi:hypothetical protein
MIRDHIEDFKNIQSYLSLAGKAYFFNIFQMIQEYCQNETKTTKAVILPRDLKKFHLGLKSIRNGIIKDKDVVKSIVNSYKDIYEYLMN